MPDQFGEDAPEQRRLVPRRETAIMPVSHGGLPSALEIMLNPAMDRQVGEIARRMAGARGLTPRHLLGCEEACYAVVLQAINWNLNPFSVACATYQTPGGRIGYEGKLVHAILEQSHRFEGDEIRHELFGPWENVRGKFEIAASTRKDSDGNERFYAKRIWGRKEAQGCGIKVSATLRNGGGERSLSLLLEQCYPMNSTLWATDPETQIGYTADRRFATAVVPGIFMGVPLAAEDELMVAGDNAIDVTEGAPRPQRAAAHVVETQSEQEWYAYDLTGEKLVFHTANGAASAIVKIFGAAARDAKAKEAVATVWDNHRITLEELAGAGYEEEVRDIEAAYEKAWQSTPAALPPSPPASSEPLPEKAASITPAPPQIAGSAADGLQRMAAVGMASRSALRDTDPFWSRDNLVVPPPLARGGRLPDWKAWPLLIGPRVRQADTVDLLNQLIADNHENLGVYAKAQGAEAALEVEHTWEERLLELKTF